MHAQAGVAVARSHGRGRELAQARELAPPEDAHGFTRLAALERMGDMTQVLGSFRMPVSGLLHAAGMQWD